MAEEKNTQNTSEGDQDSRTEAEIRQFRENLGLKDPEEEQPLFGKMEQVLDKFADVDTQDFLNALNSLSDDDD
ncbi:MAG: hypothetical protein II133_03410 [Lachnospiraceae bacterium]|nr:hypothetical protein [Lachnospiraceae bacterium]